MAEKVYVDPDGRTIRPEKMEVTQLPTGEEVLMWYEDGRWHVGTFSADGKQTSAGFEATRKTWAESEVQRFQWNASHPYRPPWMRGRRKHR